MNTTVAVIAVIAFLVLDLVFYYLIIKRMDRPSASAAFARARDLSVIPDSEGASVGLRLRQGLPLGRGDLSDIVRLPEAKGEAYLFTTMPDADSHLPRTRENQRQFVAVLFETGLSGGVFIYPPIRPPFAGFKRRRLFRVFGTTGYRQARAGSFPPGLAGRFRVSVEKQEADAAAFFSEDVAHALLRAPRRRGLAIWAGPGGLIIYINPLLADGQEAARFHDFTARLLGALSGRGR